MNYNNRKKDKMRKEKINMSTVINRAVPTKKKSKFDARAIHNILKDNYKVYKHNEEKELLEKARKEK